MLHVLNAKLRVSTGSDLCMVKGLCLLRDEHKGRLNFLPLGDNSACHSATYPAQHLHHGTGDETSVFLQRMGINQREQSDHREVDNILLQSSQVELQQEKLLEHTYAAHALERLFTMRGPNNTTL